MQAVKISSQKLFAGYTLPLSGIGAKTKSYIPVVDSQINRPRLSDNKGNRFFLYSLMVMFEIGKN